jgi:predicted RNase H-like HicB family nuclease
MRGKKMLEYHAAYYPFEDGWYMAKVLDFPGVVTQGKTLQAAKKMLRSALQDMADWHMDDGRPFPLPNSKVKDKKAALVEPIRSNPRWSARSANNLAFQHRRKSD